MATVRDEQGRKRSTYSNPQLERIVRRVARSVQPAAPTTVTPAQFDEELAKSKWSDAPRAASLRKRWRLGWYELLEIVFDEKQKLSWRTSLRRRRRPRRGPTEQEIAYALQLVAAFLRVTTLRPNRYDAGRRQLQEIAGRRWRHGDDRRYLLPTATEIQNTLDPEHHTGWDRGLELAGLRPRTGPASVAGIPVIEAVERFLEDIGCLPWSNSALVRWGALRQISVENVVGKVPAARAVVIESRRARGLWTPEAPPTRGMRPPIEVEPAPDSGPAPRKKWPTPRVLHGLALAYGHLKAGEELTQPRLLELSAGHRDIPSPSTVQLAAKREGTTARALREKAERIASGEIDGPHPDTLLSTTELAHQLGVTPNQLHGWLTEQFPRPLEMHRTTWELTKEQVSAARAWAALQHQPGSHRRAQSRPARPSNVQYVLGICDELLDEQGLRRHTFPWLHSDPKPSNNKRNRLVVDAYYERHNLVVLYREEGHAHDKRTPDNSERRKLRQRYNQRRDTEIPAHRLRLLVVRSSELATEPSGRVRQDLESDRVTLRSVLDRVLAPGV